MTDAGGVATPPAGGVGAQLAAAREARGLGLAEVAQQLKFGVRQLEALEADRFEDLPGGTFARGMVRNYARLLKLEPEPLLGRIAGRFDAPDSNQLAARFSQPVPFSDAGRRSTLVYLAGGIGILAVIGAFAWQWQRERGAPKPQMAFVKPKAEPARKAATPTPPPSKPAPIIAAPAAVEKPPAEIEEKKPAPVAEKKPAVVAENKTAVPADKKPAVAEKKASSLAAPTTAAAPAAAGGMHRIVMRVESDEAWLEVTDGNGRQIVSSLNRAGAERVVQGRGPFTFVIGNASHVRIELNGREFDLKPHTRVEVARFTLP
jgi:cytoskeleton protein RodZ